MGNNSNNTVWFHFNWSLFRKGWNISYQQQVQCLLLQLQLPKSSALSEYRFPLPRDQIELINISNRSVASFKIHTSEPRIPSDVSALYESECLRLSAVDYSLISILFSFIHCLHYWLKHAVPCVKTASPITLLRNLRLQFCTEGGITIFFTQTSLWHFIQIFSDLVVYLSILFSLTPFPYTNMHRYRKCQHPANPLQRRKIWSKYSLVSLPKGVSLSAACHSCMHEYMHVFSGTVSPLRHWTHCSTWQSNSDTSVTEEEQY